MDGLGNEDWSYDGIYDEVRSKNQIVDGINIESFDFSMKKTKAGPKTKEQHLEERTFEKDSIDSLKEETELKEDEETKETEQYRHALNQVSNLEENSESASNLGEISELFKELNELNEMLKQTLIEIKDEEVKKQRNRKLREKMESVKGLMQK